MCTCTNRHLGNYQLIYFRRPSWLQTLKYIYHIHMYMCTYCICRLSVTNDSVLPENVLLCYILCIQYYDNGIILHVHHVQQSVLKSSGSILFVDSARASGMCL